MRTVKFEKGALTKRERTGGSTAGFGGTPTTATANEHHVSCGFIEGDR